MSKTDRLLTAMYRDYAGSVGLNPAARYANGAPLRPVVPLDVGTGTVFVLGAYPSARFMLWGGLTDVPSGDNLGPFERERWFDGSRVRLQPSARELHELFLEPLGIARGSCWITDIVKVFLFKKGHAERYTKLGASVPKGYSRERFFELAARSLPWVEKELKCAQPSLLITLGAEVAGVLHGETSASAQRALLMPSIGSVTIGSTVVSTIHCAHPGILMRKNQQRNPWPSKHRNEFLPAIAAFLEGKSRHGA